MKGKKILKNDIGYGVKVAALKDMNIHNHSFDNLNDGFFNDDYSDFGAGPDSGSHRVPSRVQFRALDPRQQIVFLA